jgi:hypothetical protein
MLIVAMWVDLRVLLPTAWMVIGFGFGLLLLKLVALMAKKWSVAPESRIVLGAVGGLLIGGGLAFKPFFGGS